MPKNKKILVIIAMQAEAAPIIEALGLVEDDPPVIEAPAPCVTFSGSYKGMKLHVACNGKDAATGMDNVGTVPAALTSYLACQAFKPTLIVSAGTAGGFAAKGGQVGDVYLSSAMRNHDRRIPIPGFDQYGIGHVDAIKAPNMAADLGLKVGVVSTGNSLDCSDKCVDAMKENDASIKEMEAASIAWTAELFGLPMLCIKAVTDIVDGDIPPEEEFLANLARAAEALQDKVPQVLNYLATHHLSEL